MPRQHRESRHPVSGWEHVESAHVGVRAPFGGEGGVRMPTALQDQPGSVHATLHMPKYSFCSKHWCPAFLQHLVVTQFSYPSTHWSSTHAPVVLFVSPRALQLQGVLSISAKSGAPAMHSGLQVAHEAFFS